jgi:hypothetical protein
MTFSPGAGDSDFDFQVDDIEFLKDISDNSSPATKGKE